MQRLRLVERKRPRPEQKRVWASLQKAPKKVIGEVFDEALSRYPNQQEQWIALVDGNKTQLDLLKQYAQKHSLQLTIILDLMHVLSYLWKAAHAFFPSGSKESEEWVAEQQEQQRNYPSRYADQTLPQLQTLKDGKQLVSDI